MTHCSFSSMAASPAIGTLLIANSSSLRKWHSSSRAFLPPRKCGLRGKFSSSQRITCALQQERADDEKQQQPPLLISAKTLFQAITAIAALQVALEAYTSMESVQKMVPSPSRKKRQRTMTAEERQRWTQGLPLVEEQIPCNDVLGLKSHGKVKYIIRHPVSKLKVDVHEVFVVMDDDRVVRTILPPASDTTFWTSWDELKLGNAVTEAYTPPPPNFELPAWALKGPSLAFLKRSLEEAARKRQTAKKRPDTKSENVYRVFQSEASKRLQEMERNRLAREKEQRIKQARMEAIKRQRKLAEEQQLRDENTRRRLVQRRESRENWSIFWENAANNENVRFSLGIFFFWLFYVTVVVGVKKRRQDYEDRIKIRKAEDEERKKMKQLEKEQADENDDQVKMGIRFMKSGAKFRLARSKRGSEYVEETDVKFSDVAGLGKIRIELEEIVDFFTHAEMFRRRGCKIPSGILLCGDPGVGKTLLAKAVAGEAGVAFFAISASQFVEIYVGVGASRVRSLYQEAKDNAPAVVFIDELDAVGRMRGLSEGSGAQERDATLNQLLTCLDGFEGKGDIITIAATNRPDILDPALIRPGRFDRKIQIPKPSLQGRMEILQVHARKKPMEENVDYLSVAHMTDSMVGAQLAHVVDAAALLALRDNRTEVTTDDLLEAAQNEGVQFDRFDYGARITRILALQEASMAAMAANCPDLKNIQLISILPKAGQLKGFTRFKPDPVKYEYVQALSRQGFLDHITVQLAARAADELWNGHDKMCTIWCANVDLARKAARQFVIAGHTDRPDLYAITKCLVGSDRTREVDIEAQKIVNTCYQRALEYLDRNRTLVNALVDSLMVNKVIRPPDFQELVKRYAVLDEPRLEPQQVRDLNREAFEHQMMSKKKSVASSKP